MIIPNIRICSRTAPGHSLPFTPVDDGHTRHVAIDDGLILSRGLVRLLGAVGKVVAREAPADDANAHADARPRGEIPERPASIFSRRARECNGRGIHEGRTGTLQCQGMFC
ncbi:hypothetical protein BN1708_001084 [Verticillium longisporum]|uniref:Uncharacterized protein n=1 Tax=Verticillium longisporum TaxID=100787 RepID=A0A0G4MGM5_VERLO|nr:hypothetical protein BN1708_001084 [Verticillium longisporum]